MDPELTSPFQAFASFELCGQSRSCSPHRVVHGFCEGQASLSPNSVLHNESPSPQSSGGSGRLARQSSLGQQLRQQQQQERLPAAPKLSIRTGSSRGPLGGRGLQQLARTRSTQPLPAAAAAPPSAQADLAATLPAGSGVAHLARQQSCNMEIPARMPRACTCPLALDDDLIAAALEASSAMQAGKGPEPTPTPPAVPSPLTAFALSPSTRGRSSAAREAPPSVPPLPMVTNTAAPASGLHRSTSTPWGALPSAAQGQAAAAAPRAGPGSLLSAPSTQEQLFAAQADAVQSHAQVQCLHDALNKERAEVESLRSQLLTMTLERDGLRQDAAAAAAAAAPPAAAHWQGGLSRAAMAGVAPVAVAAEATPVFTSPFGGFSPFTPGRESPK